MARKKRQVPAAVREQLERRHRAASTLAERQGAALGKAARERLKSLLQTGTPEPTVKSVKRPLLSADLSAAFDSYLRDTMLRTLSVNWPPFSFTPVPAPPSIDPGKLEALKAAEPYRPSPRVPDMVEVITGWRGWALSSTGRLEALGKDTVWPAKRALEAECTKKPHLPYTEPHFAPGWKCTCGVWAFKDLDRLVAAVGSSYGTIRVLGTVSLWGRVIETENGYRAQYAYPSELWLLDDSLEDLGRVYEVPVRMAQRTFSPPPSCGGPGVSG